MKDEMQELAAKIRTQLSTMSTEQRDDLIKPHTELIPMFVDLLISSEDNTNHRPPTIQ